MREQLKILINYNPINIKMCKSVCFFGLADEIQGILKIHLTFYYIFDNIGLRPLYWRLILGYLPLRRE